MDEKPIISRRGNFLLCQAEQNERRPEDLKHLADAETEWADQWEPTTRYAKTEPANGRTAPHTNAEKMRLRCGLSAPKLQHTRIRVEIELTA
jgi:hypothetical protein